MLNTLKYAKQLEEVGFTREQAETHMFIMTDIIDSKLATKQDIADLRVATQHDIAELRVATQQDMTDLRRDFSELRTELKRDIADLENRMTIKLGTIVSIAIGVAVALTKLI